MAKRITILREIGGLWQKIDNFPVLSGEPGPRPGEGPGPRPDREKTEDQAIRGSLHRVA